MLMKKNKKSSRFLRDQEDNCSDFCQERTQTRSEREREKRNKKISRPSPNPILPSLIQIFLKSCHNYKDSDSTCSFLEFFFYVSFFCQSSFLCVAGRGRVHVRLRGGRYSYRGCDVRVCFQLTYWEWNVKVLC